MMADARGCSRNPSSRFALAQASLTAPNALIRHGSDPAPGDQEIVQGALGVDTPVNLVGNRQLTQQVVLDSHPEPPPFGFLCGAGMDRPHTSRC